MVMSNAIEFMYNVTRKRSTVFMNHVPTPATHVGDVKVKIQSFIFELKNALIVPKSNDNLISVPCLQRTGHEVQFKPGSRNGQLEMAMIFQGKEVVAASYSFLPRSKFSYVPMNSVNVLTPNTVPAWITGLHKRLAHIKCSGLKSLDATKELRLTKEQRTILNSIDKIPCVECDNAGLHAAPVKAQSTHPLEKTRGVAYVDLHGPLIMSRGGAIWILALRES